jgi:uncharacterized membrane protein
MVTLYNRIAGQSVERLAALSDGVFAVAMTLLVLDLRVPAAEAVRNEHDLWHALVALSPRLLTYMMSFLTLGIFWVGQQTQLNHLARSDRSLTWIHIAFLFAVSMTPFSTTLLAEFIAYRLAVVVYWLNILLLGATLYFSWVCAVGSGLVKADMSPEFPRGVQAAGPYRAGAVCGGSAALSGEHLPEHRIHSDGSAELRHRATHPRAFPFLIVANGIALCVPSKCSGP